MIIDNIHLKCKTVILNLMKYRMLPNTYKCLFNQTVSINELIEWNGFKVIFEDYSYTLFPSTSRLSMGLGIIMKILNLTLRQGTENLQTFIKPLEKPNTNQ